MVTFKANQPKQMLHCQMYRHVPCVTDVYKVYREYGNPKIKFSKLDLLLLYIIHTHYLAKFYLLIILLV